MGKAAEIPDIQALEDELLYKYTSVEEAPDTHRRVLRFAIQRVPIQEIAQLASVSRDVVHRVLAHPPNKRYLEMREFQLKAEVGIIHDMMSEGRIRVLELLQQKVEELGSAMKLPDLLKLAGFYGDRHQDGAIVKRNKTEIAASHTVVDGRRLETLKHKAALAGVESAQKAIAVKAQEVTDVTSE